VYPDLVDQRFGAVDLLADTLGRAEVVGRDRELREITLSADEVQAWLGVLNDTRLILGTRLGVAEDQRAIDPSDPNARPPLRLLTWVQGDLLRGAARSVSFGD
jgi:hypothetical protein